MNKKDWFSSVEFSMLALRCLDLDCFNLRVTLSHMVRQFDWKERVWIWELPTKYWVQNQCCGSGMFIPDPDFYPSRIPDTGSKNSNKREGRKKFVIKLFLKSQISQNWIFFIFLKCWRKKFGPIFKEFLKFLPKIIFYYTLKWVWDPGSGKNLFRIQDPGSRVI